MKSRRFAVSIMFLIAIGTLIFAGCSSDGPSTAESTSTTADPSVTDKDADDDDHTSGEMMHNVTIADEFKDSKNPFLLKDGSGYEPAAMAQGKDLYMANCTACHGEKGDGKGSSAAGLNPPPRDFTDKHLSTMDERQMMTTISNGSEGSAMAPFSAKFNIEERWQLISYLCTLNSSGKCAAPGSADNMINGSSDNMMDASNDMMDTSKDTDDPSDDSMNSGDHME